MKLYPAIDIRNGNCVRLYQGDYGQETVYGYDPAAQAKQFAAEGSQAIHVVDLDAAKSGQRTNMDAIAALCAAVSVPVQVGGGVRSLEAAQALFDVGVGRVVIGTAALENPTLVVDLVARNLPVVVGLDARGTAVATHGWTHDSGRTLAELAAQFADVGVEALVVTEIGRDGTLVGPDVEGLTDLLHASEIPIIASGGVGTIDDLTRLAGVTAKGRRLEGAIVGRALYEQRFDVAEALIALEATPGTP